VKAPKKVNPVKEVLASTSKPCQSIKLSLSIYRNGSGMSHLTHLNCATSKDY